MMRNIECGKVNNLLSEYIDGALDAHLKKIINEHLTVCDICSEELRSLETVVNALQSLDRVNASDDFSEKVHKRIKSDSFFNKASHVAQFFSQTICFLFTSPKRKLSFQVIAALVIVVLTIFSVQEITKETPHMPSESKKSDITESSDKKRSKTSEKVYTAERESAVPFLQEQEETEEPQIITLTLAIRAEKSELSSIPLPYPSNEFPVMKGQREITREKAPPSLSENNFRKETSQPQIYRERPQMPEQQIMKPAKKKFTLEEGTSKGTSSKDKASLPPSSEAIIKIKKLIASVEGSVTSLSYDEHSGNPRFIHAVIPTRNFNDFLEKLKDIGDLKEALPQIPESGASSVNVKIKLLFLS
jgi:hypothetical protein